ncbi:MAG: acyl-CoA dehydrogenase family protein [Acidimicrobiia bacterium]|nr:acyl-CoA dehydrogenase family protein [Acidimicrobiia bacterium]
MRLGWTEADETFRAELVAFLDARVPAEATVRPGFGYEPDAGIPAWARRWQALLFDRGWMVPGYPPELGGRNATPSQTMVYLEELSRRGVPRSLHFGGYAIVGPSLLEFGSDEQKELVPAAIRGDTIWCVGMSEPGAGSDLAGLSTRAERHGDVYVVNGQKVWTTYAAFADRCFLYVRTDPTVAKHKGISALIVDMATPGIEVRPLRHLTGGADFAEVFFTDCEVPAANLVGAENDGWRITTGSLAHERGGLWVEGVGRAQVAVEELCALARRRGLDGDPGVRRRLARAHQRVASLKALGYQGFAAFAGGGAASEHSYLKLASSELGKELYELGMALQGPWGAVIDPDIDDGGRWPYSFFVSFASTIAGGTSQIQRNIIAQRVLGLPRS